MDMGNDCDKYKKKKKIFNIPKGEKVTQLQDVIAHRSSYENDEMRYMCILSQPTMQEMTQWQNHWLCKKAVTTCRL